MRMRVSVWEAKGEKKRGNHGGRESGRVSEVETERKGVGGRQNDRNQRKACIMCRANTCMSVYAGMRKKMKQVKIFKKKEKKIIEEAFIHE